MHIIMMLMKCLAGIIQCNTEGVTLVLSCLGAPYSIGGASSLRGARSSRLGAYIPSCSSHGQEADHIP